MPSRDPALVLAAVDAVVGIVHGGGWSTVLATIPAGTALAAGSALAFRGS